MRCLACIALIVAGCAGELSTSDRCEETRHCNAGRVCFSGRCVDPHALCAGSECGLFAVTPAAAMSGDSIEIEGTFGEHEQVRFPNDKAVVPSVLSSHHITVTVPEAAGSGDITVSDGRRTLGSAPFRQVMFVPELVESSAEQTVSQREVPRLVRARVRFSLVQAGDYAFVVGGEDSAGVPLASVERALLNADGTLSAFSVYSASTLREARAGASVLVAGGWVFVIGGSGIDGEPLASIERAALTADGGLEDFERVAYMHAARSDAVVALIGDALVVAAGRSCEGRARDDIETFTLDSRGELHPSFDTGLKLSAARIAAAGVVLGRELLIMGGYDSDGHALSNYERVALRDSQVESAIEQDAIVPRAGASAVRHGDSIFLIGGESDAAPVPTIERARISDHLVFERVGSLAVPRASAQAFVHENTIQVVGGRGPSGALASVERLALDAQVELGLFAAADRLEEPQEGPAVVLGRWVYLIGGKDKTNSLTAMVQRARVGSDGSLGMFRPVGSLVAARKDHMIAAVGANVYSLGGYTKAGQLALSIERAEILSNGSLGSFTESGVSLVVPRRGAQVVMCGNYLYVLGGCTEGEVPRSPIDSIERARITSGMLESFETMGKLSVARCDAAPLVTGNTVYLAGGLTSDDKQAKSIESLTCDPTGVLSISSPAPSAALKTSRQLAASLLVGDTWYVLGGYNAPGDHALKTIESAKISSLGEPDGFQPDGALLQKRNYGAGLVLGNWAYVIGGQYLAGKVSDTIERAPLIRPQLD